MISTFSGFQIAKRGIQTARANLQITGQNMTNVNTAGYTKQKVDSNSVGPTDNNSHYAGSTLQIGNGVESTKTTQSRDPYLDIKYRSENAKVGETGILKDTLSDVETVYDETVNNGISSQLSSLISQLNTLSGTPSDTSLENIVKNSALLLTQEFNSASKSLSKVRTETQDTLQSDAVSTVNNLLKNIASLNEEIKSADVSGSTALELRDQRNTYIDSLSKYVNIKVTSSPDAVNPNVSIVQIDLVSGANKFNLVDDSKYNQFSAAINTDGTATMSLKTTDSPPVDVKVTGGTDTLKNSDFTTGSIKGYMDLLNNNGEYDSPATTRGIGYYQKVLDSLASDFASVMNKANSTDAAGTNKAMFTQTDGTTTTGITAGNISISNKWNNVGTGSFITATKNTGVIGTSDESKDGSNILAMKDALSAKKTYDTKGDGTGSTLFSGSITTYMSTVTNSILALQLSDVKRQDTTNNTELTSTQSDRDSVSAVDINEEGINLMSYNQALSASSRFMTTLDDALDTIINKMGVI